jgi:uncharacterized protein (UPF0335 family)
MAKSIEELTAEITELFQEIHGKVDGDDLKKAAVAAIVAIVHQNEKDAAELRQIIQDYFEARKIGEDTFAGEYESRKKKRTTRGNR